MDNELLELCKEVYKRTSWVNIEPCYSSKCTHHGFYEEGVLTAPKYTLDFLLECLPAAIEIVKEQPYSYTVSQIAPIQNLVRADTPMKALLKFVIVLDDAGELSDDPTR